MSFKQSTKMTTIAVIIIISEIVLNAVMIGIDKISTEHSTQSTRARIVRFVLITRTLVMSYSSLADFFTMT